MGIIRKSWNWFKNKAKIKAISVFFSSTRNVEETPEGPCYLMEIPEEVRLEIYGKLDQSSALNLRLANYTIKDEIDNFYIFKLYLPNRKSKQLDKSKAPFSYQFSPYGLTSPIYKQYAWLPVRTLLTDFLKMPIHVRNLDLTPVSLEEMMHFMKHAEQEERDTYLKIHKKLPVPLKALINNITYNWSTYESL